MANSKESVDVKCSYKLQPQTLGSNLLGLNKKKKVFRQLSNSGK